MAGYRSRGCSCGHPRQGKAARPCVLPMGLSEASHCEASVWSSSPVTGCLDALGEIVAWAASKLHANTQPHTRDKPS